MTDLQPSGGGRWWCVRPQQEPCERSGAPADRAAHAAAAHASRPAPAARQRRSDH